jgi:hypothetical protein
MKGRKDGINVILYIFNRMEDLRIGFWDLEKLSRRRRLKFDRFHKRGASRDTKTAIFGSSYMRRNTTPPPPPEKV